MNEQLRLTQEMYRLKCEVNRARHNGECVRELKREMWAIWRAYVAVVLADGVAS